MYARCRFAHNRDLHLSGICYTLTISNEFDIPCCWATTLCIVGYVRAVTGLLPGVVYVASEILYLHLYFPSIQPLY